MLGLVGAWDDLFDLGARFKLLTQIVLSLLFAVFVARIEAIPLTSGLNLPLGAVVGVIGTALWLVVVINAVNFMDGANGLAPGAVAITLLAFALTAFQQGAPSYGGTAIVAALAAFGFLPWNFPKARLFQGDAGALFSGFLLAALAVIGAGPRGQGPVFLLFAPLALLPFLVDVLLTLLVRAKAKKRLFDAHSEHLYQRLADEPWPIPRRPRLEGVWRHDRVRRGGGRFGKRRAVDPDCRLPRHDCLRHHSLDSRQPPEPADGTLTPSFALVTRH